MLTNGSGKLYLGFHLDPFHQVHWNNLNDPLQYKLEVPKGVKIGKLTDKAAKVKAATDADPREFLLTVDSWPEDKSVQLTVSYFACVGEQACYAVQQTYVLYCRRDRDGGGARGEGAGYWDPEAYAKQMLARDKSGKGKLSKEEVQGLVRPYFEYFDTNKDGFLDLEELKAVGEWLNHHHKPGPAPRAKK